MNEASTMFTELDHWEVVIGRLKRLAVEMESGEQDAAYISDQIDSLFHSVADFEPDENGISDRYSVDFEHPRLSGCKLVFEFVAYFKE